MSDKYIYRQRGFTLVELLVVIAIISVLSSIVIVSLDSATQAARDAERVQTVVQIRTALYGAGGADSFPDTTGGVGEYQAGQNYYCLGYSEDESCFSGRHTGLDSLNEALGQYMDVPRPPQEVEIGDRTIDAYLYHSHCQGYSGPLNGGRGHMGIGVPDDSPCIVWFPEDELSDEYCAPGVMGVSGGQVCGGGTKCYFCSLRLQ